MNVTYLTFSTESKWVNLSKVSEINFAGQVYEDTKKKWHKLIQIKDAHPMGITHKTPRIATLRDTKTDSDCKW